ncbi:MAG TPA: PLP-dependent aminotransferase family protein, partial [Thermomicrobiales bacterium]|nr:PLP-dependent aminotransferase family protein [Thermomicrobiales bacterium]
GALLGILPSAGHKRHRQILASWTSANHGLPEVDWRRLIVTTGGQHALNLALRSLTEPGDTVLIEASTFFGFRTAAEHHRVNLHPVRIDRQGMDPESLEAAIRQTGARIVYLQPTLHNPTTRSMPPARRREIAAIIRQHGLTLIEGDVYGALARHGALREKLPLPIPIATLIPERTWFISSMGKVVASGLRVGLLIVPDRDATETVNLKMRADCYASSPVGTELIVRMISDGTTIHLIDEIVHQATQRTKLACEALSPWIEKPSYSSSLHIWMPMPELDAERLYGCALRNDIILTPPAAFSFGTPGPTGIRLCLNGPASTEHLTKALDVIVSTMRHTPTSRTHSII